MNLIILLFLSLLFYKQASTKVWLTSLIFLTLFAPASSYLKILLYAALTITLMLYFFRKKFITPQILKVLAKKLPKISDTEQKAIDAGTIGWEKELLTTKPNFELLLNSPDKDLSEEEQNFIDGPLKQLCGMLNDWEITHQLLDMPDHIWQFIKDKGFFGLIIPKQYGGLGFSAIAHMQILVKLYGCSITVASTVSVPNSLGPAELLLNYGTIIQKNYYLPRLAKGIDIPCFALTGPEAGSDAASLPDSGVVCKQNHHGKEIIGINLNFDKRYITLAPVATVIGLAFRLFDPDNLIGKTKDIGISCALISVNTPGLKVGRRHFPLNIPFMNGPISGKNVFIPLDNLIGGVEMAGLGWKMLMECLSAGRAISLPSSALGGAQLVSMVTSGYVTLRRQFNQPISNFEGIEEPLSRIAGNTWIIDAVTNMTIAAIDRGEKPAVAGAILKYHTTQRAREIIIDAMDIHGGKGICLGPLNYLARGYQAAPISITVEGANILTRNLIIYGQGFIRSHPYLLEILQSAAIKDVDRFDKVFFTNASFFISNLFKNIVFNFTNAHGSVALKSKVKHHYRYINYFSAKLTFLSDFAMLVLGSSLKRREKISARLGDIFSYLYMAAAVLKKFHANNEPDSELDLVEWSCQSLFYECSQALESIVANFPCYRIFIKLIILPKKFKYPSDALGKKIAKILTEPSATRNHMIRFVYKDLTPHNPAGLVEKAFLLYVQKGQIPTKKILKAHKNNLVQSLSFSAQLKEAYEKNIIDTSEYNTLLELEQMREKIIAVDDFEKNELKAKAKIIDISK